MTARFQPACFYCEHNQTQQDRMTLITPLDVSTFYLNRDQTHPGRGIVALNWHVDELFALDDAHRNLFMHDVARAAWAIKQATGAAKINYAIYGDTVSHLHFHLVPKLPTDLDWDGAFVNQPEGAIAQPDEALTTTITQLRELIEQAYHTL